MLEKIRQNPINTTAEYPGDQSSAAYTHTRSDTLTLKFTSRLNPSAKDAVKRTNCRLYCQDHLQWVWSVRWLFSCITKAPQVDPGCTRHIVAQNNLHSIWFALAASAKLDPAHTDKLWGQLLCACMSLSGQASTGFSLLNPYPSPPPSSFNSLTIPWHLRVPGIRLKWEKGH